MIFAKCAYATGLRLCSSDKAMDLQESMLARLVPLEKSDALIFPIVFIVNKCDQMELA